MAAIIACAAFGSVCGSSIATAATMAKVALPEMRRLNYSGRLATATLAAGGTLGIMIPPSVVARDLCDPRRAEHRQAVRRRDRPGPHCNRRLLSRHRRLCPAVPLASSCERSPRGRTAVGAEGVWPIALIFVLVFGGIYAVAGSRPTEAAAIGAATTFLAGLPAASSSLAGIKAHLLLRNRRSLPG